MQAPIEIKARPVLVIGINTDICIYTAPFIVSAHGYQAVAISNCVAGMRGLDHHWMALELMSRSIAWLMTAEAFRAKLWPWKSRRLPQRTEPG